jgi:hypothetical protein
MTARVFTFGHGQTCPFTGKNLLDHHVTIVAPTEDICRDIMFATFGEAWAFDYPSVEAATGHGDFPSTEHMRIEMTGGDQS